MIQAILFDLDDTLLGNDMDVFLPAYFKLLTKHAARVMAPQRFMEVLLACTDEMIKSTDTAVSNRDTFWQAFYHMTGKDADEMELFFDTFYRDIFPQLAETTSPRPEAVRLVQDAFALGLQVVVATNPLFPRRAVEHRLAWAGLPVSEYPFALVTTYENMHSAKPHPSYYREILQKIGVAPKAALMVGDSWENDMEPAAAVGMFTYWVSNGRDVPPVTWLHGHGTVAGLRGQVQTGWLASLAAVEVS